MSDPWAAPGREQRYDELLQQAGAALIGAAPPGWRRIDLVVRVAAGVQDFGLSVVMADLSDAVVDPPAQAAQALLELRALTYTPELGAWFSARYVVDPPSEFRIFYNYEHDPAGATSPPDLDRIPPRPLGLEQQRDLHRRITNLLVMRAPADRDQIRVMFRAAGTHVDLVGHILGLDGRLREWEPPPEVPDILRQLRAGMYRDGAGVWSAAAIVVEYPINDWPIQPLTGEPPLTLLAGKHIAVLMPGRELVRYGAPAGNLTFAAGTGFDAMSLRTEREQQGPRRYRVVRELRTLSGQAVPWHDRPGGGTAYLLPEAVEQHLTNGSLMTGTRFTVFCIPGTGRSTRRHGRETTSCPRRDQASRPVPGCRPGLDRGGLR